MSSRRPLQPIPALPANGASTRYARSTTTTTAADGKVKMADGVQDNVQDNVQDAGSVVSGLSSLEGDDDFERLMIQNARDERRLHEALTGRAQPFRRARTHARVGLTVDNLERNDAQNNTSSNSNSHANSNVNTNTNSNVNANTNSNVNANTNSNVNTNTNTNTNTNANTNTRIALKSPPSSSGSTRSDPAIHAPAGWGRKGRSTRNWMRTITRDEQPHPTPAPPDETAIEQHGDDDGGDGANAPRRSVEDSPLSHKSFNQPTPRRDTSAELDLTFDMNEASMLVSTPYIPRNTKLDDIREREIESLREQPSPARSLRKRTNSWQSLAQSQPELGKEKPPITVYRKSVETVGVVERGVVASADRQLVRPFSKRPTDSQGLLRRLARLSNTPSPNAAAPARPQTAPTNTLYTTPEGNEEAVKETPAQDTSTASTRSTSTPQEQLQREQRHDTPHHGTTPDAPSSAPTTATENVDATPMPVERTVLNPKTPYVMGGWVDTPGPRTAHKPVELPRPRSPSPQRGSPSKPHVSNRPTALADDKQPPVEQSSASPHPPLPRHQLPGSALQALVQEARASHDYGDDTIHSLEDLITPLADNETEEDTLQGLELPTSAPRNEAERERQAEVMNLHRLNRHLRATSTNIRDVSRGMRRVETRMEHIEVEGTGEKMPVIVRHLSPDFSPWVWFRSFFWDERLKTQRQVQNAPLNMWGGVTLLGILLTLSFIWWASETVACEIFCHPEYASYSPYPFAVNMDAPKRGVVIPTLVYRALFKGWSTPIVSPIESMLSWIWTTLWSLASGASVTGLYKVSYEAAANGGPAMAAHTQANWQIQEETHEEDSWDWSMAEDEVLRR